MENFVLQPQPEMETSPEPDVPGSHDEFWVFSPVSQWGSKWVYSDHDIFVREMISNGCDAITTKRRRMT